MLTLNFFDNFFFAISFELKNVDNHFRDLLMVLVEPRSAGIFGGKAAWHATKSNEFLELQKYHLGKLGKIRTTWDGEVRLDSVKFSSLSLCVMDNSGSTPKISEF